MIVHAAESVIECASQFAGCALDGLVNGLRLMRDRNGLVTFKARFQHTALVMFPSLITVLIAEVDFDAGNMLDQLAQSALHLGFCHTGNLFMIVDTMV